MSIRVGHASGRPQTPAESHTAATVRREPTGQAEASFLLSVPSARPVTITTEQTEHAREIEGILKGERP